MKKYAPLWGLALISVGLILGMTFFHCSGSGSTTPVGKNSFYNVTSKLDKGGDIYLYISTDKVIKKVDELAQGLRGLIAKAMEQSGESDPKGMQIFDLIYDMVKKSGFMDINGVGFSSVAIGENLNHSKFVVQHDKDKGKGLIWNLCGQQPHDLALLNYLPATTTLAGYGDFKPAVLWNFIKENLGTGGIPEVKEQLDTLEPMLKQQGIELAKLLDSISGMGYMLTLDHQKMVKLQMGPINFEIPDPGLAIVIKVKEPAIFDLLKKQIEAKGQKVEEKDGVQRINIPLPPFNLPINLKPAILQTKGMLILASNPELVDAMFAAEKDGNGLKSTDEFKKLAKNISLKGNSFKYQSPKFFNTIMKIQEQSLAAAGQNANEQAEAMAFFHSLFPKEMGSFGIETVTSEGSIYTFNHNMSFTHVVLLPAVFVGGIVAAIAIPNMIVAMQKGKQKATMGELRSAGLAIEAYITDKGEAPPAKNFEELKAKLVPFYAKMLPDKDGWGNELLYKHGTGSQKEEYFIGAPCRDGIFDGFQQTGQYIVTTQQEFGNDIIYSNGSFVYGPKVK
jgi:hypothetical protein